MNGFHRIRRFNRVMLVLIGFDQSGKHIEAVAIGRTDFGSCLRLHVSVGGPSDRIKICDCRAAFAAHCGGARAKRNRATVCTALRYPQ